MGHSLMDLEFTSSLLLPNKKRSHAHLTYKNALPEIKDTFSE